MGQAIRWGVEVAVIVFAVATLFGCANIDPKTQARIQAAETVAQTACEVRREHPIAAEVLHQAYANFVPGGEIAHETIQIGCNVLLGAPR